MARLRMNSTHQYYLVRPWSPSEQELCYVVMNRYCSPTDILPSIERSACRRHDVAILTTSSSDLTAGYCCTKHSHRHGPNGSSHSCLLSFLAPDLTSLQRHKIAILLWAILGFDSAPHQRFTPAAVLLPVKGRREGFCHMHESRQT